VADNFVIAFHAPTMLPDLIASDVVEGAPVGSEWCITSNRGAEQIGIVKLFRMTSNGSAEQPSAQGARS
jgi:hypothetical protein